jgi:hypothetical protein
MLALGVASSPRLQTAAARPALPSTATSGHATVPAATASIENPIEMGRGGFGAMIGCAACAVAAGLTIAGGPAAILIAVNAPGSAVALLACAATCYEAFQ